MKMLRREALALMATLPVLGLCSAMQEDSTTTSNQTGEGGKSNENLASESYADSAEADRWMQAWMPMAAVAGALHVMRFADGYYAVTKNIAWTSEGAEVPKRTVSVPTGFVTDFASIPRIFWSALPRDGQYTYAAIIHDYLYWNQATSREEGDDIFKAVMEEFNVPALQVGMIYRAVRAGGSGAWSTNDADKKRGEKRVLRRLPDDPKIKWSDWKLEAGVFA